MKITKTNSTWDRYIIDPGLSKRDGWTIQVSDEGKVNAPATGDMSAGDVCKVIEALQLAIKLADGTLTIE